MADEAGKNNKPFDPMEPWRGMRDAYMDVWAKAMVDMVNSEAYAGYSGILRNTYLIGPDGKIAQIWEKVKVAGHAEDVLAAAKALEKR